MTRTTTTLHYVTNNAQDIIVMAVDGEVVGTWNATSAATADYLRSLYCDELMVALESNCPWNVDEGLRIEDFGEELRDVVAIRERAGLPAPKGCTMFVTRS